MGEGGSGRIPKPFIFLREINISPRWAEKRLGGSRPCPCMVIIRKCRVGSCGHSHTFQTGQPPESDVFGQIGLGPSRWQSGAGGNILQRHRMAQKDTESHENTKSNNPTNVQNGQRHLLCISFCISFVFPIKSPQKCPRRASRAVFVFPLYSQWKHP